MSALISPGVVITRFGALDANPLHGETIIPRDYGEAPSYFTVNLRLSRTFGLGSGKSGGTGDTGAGVVRAPLPDILTVKRHNLTLSVSARNLLNRTNPATPTGSLTSPFFGIATAAMRRLRERATGGWRCSCG